MATSSVRTRLCDLDATAALHCRHRHRPRPRVRRLPPRLRHRAQPLGALPWGTCVVVRTRRRADAGCARARRAGHPIVERRCHGDPHDRAPGQAARHEDAPVPRTGRRGVARQHRRGRVSPAWRARSMGVDSRREHRQPAVDPLARRTRAQRDPLLSSLQRSTGEELHGRLLGSARRRQVVLPRHPSIVDDRRAIHLRSRRSGRSGLREARQDEGRDLRALLGAAPSGALRSTLSQRRLRRTSAADNTATPPPARRLRTRTALPRRSVAAIAGR